MDILDKFDKVKEGKGIDGNTMYRKPIGLYYKLKDLYNDGKLTTWEMNEADKLFNNFLNGEQLATEIKRG